MSARSASPAHAHSIAAMLFVASLLATWLAYLPGVGGSLHFDDPPNLQGLASVNDSTSAFAFVASGTAGPLGRPLALGSFLPEAHAWPDMPEVFLRTNILIHLINGALVVWFLYLLGLARNQTEKEAALIGVGAGAIWMLMPLLASSSLLIVQRMTTLSALFMLLGAVGYLYARRSIERSPLPALLGMTLAVAMGAALGALAKENGALLFLFILTVESILLKRPSALHPRLWRTWFVFVLVSPLAVLLFILGAALPYPESEILRRGFSGLERLITQAEILWKYLYLAFLPNVPSLGPFHDDYETQRNIWNSATFLAISAWLLVVCAAVVARRRAPLFSFAVAWFLLGHLLESTTFSLELYFEHRNYMPMIGPVYALIASLHYLSASFRRLMTLAAASYAAILGMVLFSFTSLWGAPTIAAELWSIYKPASMRATIYLARSLESQGDLYTARRVLHTYLDLSPNDQGVQLYALGISCQSRENTDHQLVISDLEQALPNSTFSQFVVASYQRLDDLVRAEQCLGVDEEVIYRFGTSILHNPRFSSGLIQHNVHMILARLAIEQRDLGLTMRHLDEALRFYPNTSTLRFAIDVLNSAGLHSASWELLRDFLEKKPPRNPLAANKWAGDLDDIEKLLRTMKVSGNSQNPAPHDGL
jgi:protein O-mannosyl-transferase